MRKGRSATSPTMARGLTRRALTPGQASSWAYEKGFPGAQTRHNSPAHCAPHIGNPVTALPLGDIAGTRRFPSRTILPISVARLPHSLGASLLRATLWPSRYLRPLDRNFPTAHRHRSICSPILMPFFRMCLHPCNVFCIVPGAHSHPHEYPGVISNLLLHLRRMLTKLLDIGFFSGHSL